MTAVLAKSRDPVWKRVRGSFVLNLIAPGLVLFSALVSFLVHHGYDVGRPEVWISGSALLAAGLVIGLPCAVRPLTLGWILLGICILVFLDLSLTSFGLHIAILGWGSTWSTAAWHAAVTAGVMLLAWGLRRYLATVIVVSFSVFSISTFLLAKPSQMESPGLKRAQEPVNSGAPLLHLVFDEFTGIEGIPTDIEGGATLKDELERFFVENGFTLYGGAFSHTSVTRQTLSALLNGLAYPNDEISFRYVDGSWRLPRNDWFEELERGGYGLRVYHTSWMSFCHAELAALESCAVYQANSIAELTNIAMPAAEKAEVILSAFLEAAPMLDGLRRLLGLKKYRLGPLLTEAVLQSIVADLSVASRGRAVFAHLLSPHYSYVYDSDCRVKPTAESWLNRYIPFSAETGVINTAASRERRYRAYFAQIRCTVKQLKSFFQELRDLGLYDEATIIIHSDHGSRIATRNPMIKFRNQLTDRQILDSYSTFYAVKRPGVAGAYDARALPIQALFANSFLGRDLPEDRQQVILRWDGSEEFKGRDPWHPYPGATQ